MDKSFGASSAPMTKAAAIAGYQSELDRMQFDASAIYRFPGAFMGK